MPDGRGGIWWSGQGGGGRLTKRGMRDGFKRLAQPRRSKRKGSHAKNRTPKGTKRAGRYPFRKQMRCPFLKRVQQKKGEGGKGRGEKIPAPRLWGGGGDSQRGRYLPLHVSRGKKIEKKNLQKREEVAHPEGRRWSRLR